MTTKYVHELIKENEYLPAYFNEIHCRAITIPVHWHDHLELVYFISGNMTAIIQAQTYKVTPGTLMILNSKELHMTTTYGDNHYLLLQIPTIQMQNLFPEFHQLKFQTLISVNDSSNDTMEIQHLFQQMLDVYHKKEEGYPLLFTSHLYMLLFHLYKHYRIAEQSNQTHAQNRDFRRITQTMNWMNKNFREQLSLDDAAANLSISKEHFCRLFKKCTGQTFLEYLYSVRTMNLYEDLKRTDTKLTLLLEKNGITNYKLFMRIFKKMYGDTPQKLRKKIQL